jgi:uncharacterized protein (DUF1330 family)
VAHGGADATPLRAWPAPWNLLAKFGGFSLDDRHRSRAMAGLLRGPAELQPSRHPMKKLLLSLLVAGAIATGSSAVASDTAPKSVIHVVTVAFKAGTSPEAINAALDGVKKLPGQYAGITRVWTNAVKVQNPAGATVKKTHVIVMEFASAQALKDYTDSPAQKEWYKLYLPIRDVSTTYDITN